MEDIRRKKTKKALINALSELLSEKEMDKISVQDIIREAEISRTTFYRIYQDKYAFLEDVKNDLIDGMFRAADNQGGGRPYFRRMLTYICQHKSLFYVFKECGKWDDFQQEFFNRGIGIYKSHLKQSRHMGDIPEDILVNYIVSAHGGVMSCWLQSDCIQPPEVLAGYLEKLTLSGVFRAAGIGEEQIRLPK